MPTRTPAETTARPRLPSTVVALGAVSLLNDGASEMIYPLLPAFLATLGGGPALLGLIEGVAEATASLVKLGSGWLADRVGRLKGLTLAGYAVATLLRPLLALAQNGWHILLVRFGDRVGKGVRTTPRDALLAAAAPAAIRGRAYGFHRAMDHGGAIVGTAIGALLVARGVPLRHVFAWAAAPGVLALLVLALFVRREAARAAEVRQAALGLAPQPAYRRMLVAVAVFTLGNSSDAFLLWRARELGAPTVLAPALWIVLHVVKAATSTFGGALSDRVGRRLPILAGWAVYAAVYLGFGLARAAWQVWPLFAVYGVYFGLTEGVEKAFVVDLVDERWRGRALGAYHAAVGLAALPASALFGLVYRAAGASAAFGLGAALAALAALLLPRAPRPSPPV